MFKSATGVPETGTVPRHVAVIMDGNGRWANRHALPRIAGHKRGIQAVRNTVRRCGELGIEYLTLFAFSSENWHRPADEVSFLMRLFMTALEEEIDELHEKGVRFRVVGDLSRFEPRLTSLIRDAERLTSDNRSMTLTIAANYGGRWDIMQAVKRMVTERSDSLADLGENDLSSYLALNFAPEPDLLIRTGGEQRLSNFMLWQLAYTEFYFTGILWPDFDAATLDQAIASYGSRERRFGRISEQLPGASGIEALRRSTG